MATTPSGVGTDGGTPAQKKPGALLRYNEADCVNLQPLAEAFYHLMVQSTRPSSTA